MTVLDSSLFTEKFQPILFVAAKEVQLLGYAESPSCYRMSKNSLLRTRAVNLTCPS